MGIRVDYDRYRVPEGGGVKLSDFPTLDTQGLTDKQEAKKQEKQNLKKMVSLQERLYAEGERALLIVLQAMDTAGKDSTIREVTRGINPQGCWVVGFKAPTRHELDRDFLWRVHRAVPPRGYIGIFNRSHYEDVLIVRVHEWASPGVIEQRYEHIRSFEKLLHDGGTRVLKIMLNISKDYQLGRLRQRLEEPEKHWKFNPGDLKERALWDRYMESYEIALNRCSTDAAPWYVVPAEKRWFRDILITQLIVETLEDMNPQFPPADFDIADYPPESLT